MSGNHNPDLLRSEFKRRYLAEFSTYVGGLMTLGFAAKQPGLADVDAATIRARAEAAGVLGATEYWTPDLHASAFHLPPYIRRHLPD